MVAKAKNHESPTRLVGYCRVSTEKQADEGVSLDAQWERLHQYAELYGHELVSVHQDDLSGKTLDRPGLKAALADLKKGAEGLLVVKLDRLTRNVSDLNTLIVEYFADGKWHLHSVNEHIDTRSASGRLVLNMLSSVSQWEREVIGERTKDALNHLKNKGVKLGRAPLGWARAEDVDGDGRRVVQDVESEQETVARIVELREQGLSLRKIGDVLEEEGRKTKRGGRWQAQTIATILERGVS